MAAPSPHFDHEKLVAYQRSIQFIVWCSPLFEKLPKKLAVADQLDRASTSVPLNLAEGNAKYTPPDRCRYFDTARGSALECAACLDVLVAKGQCTVEEIQKGKELLREAVSLIIGLVRSVGPDRLGEELGEYRISPDTEQGQRQKSKSKSKSKSRSRSKGRNWQSVAEEIYHC